MRAIMVMFDTLTRDYLPAYGNDWVHAPNFSRLEEHSITFDQFYGGSMPCMPARRELHTGKYNFMHRGWGPLEPFDYSVFEALGDKGIYSHLVTDHSHYFEDGGATYHNRYNTWEGFRGQEGDRWVPRREIDQIPPQHSLNKKGVSVTQHHANRLRQEREEDMSTVRTINAGLDFLGHHADKDNWFLQIECFDPHEPFYVPEKYRALYEDMDEVELLNWPAYQRIDADQNPQALKKARKEYAALVSMCDFHLGRILDFMDEHDMWKDTMLIVNTDHGFLLGEHDFFGKNFPPMYEEVIHTPFFLHDPTIGKDGERCSQLAQTIDIAPYLLDYFQLEPHQNMDGCSLYPAVKNDEEIHETILFGVNGGHANIFDGEHVFMKAAESKDNQPLVNLTLMPTHMRGFFALESLEQMELVEGNKFTNGIPCLKIPTKTYMNSVIFGDLLYHIPSDPKQQNPICNQEIFEQMKGKLIKAMKNIEAPEEEYIRLGLRANKEG